MLKNLRSRSHYKSFLLTVATTFFLNCALATEIARSQDLNKRITIDADKKTLKETLDQISSQAHVGIIYSNAKGILKKPVTIHVKDQPVSKVLSDLLSPLTLTYEIIGDQIVVKFDKTSSRPPSQDPSETQRFPIKGKVTDGNGAPLPGATIKIKNGPTLVTTDSNGEFQINNLADSTVLQISFIGYSTKEIIVSSATFLNIVLENGSNQLNEVSVVSTGYQTIPKERATGSFSQPIKEMYDARVSTDVISKLNGITNGLLFNSNTTSTQRGQLDLNIRGRSTIFANDQPLIVIDNFPYSGDINNINPNDVETISVLKDAAAASIWGVRAGNGVIVITTKKGKNSQPLKVAFNSNFTITNKPDLNYNPAYISSSDYIDVEQFLFKNNKYDASLSDNITYPFISPVVEILAQQRAGTLSANAAAGKINEFRNYDLLADVSKLLYQRPVKQQYFLNLNGGDAKTTYLFSAGFDKDPLIQKYNDLNRLTINSNLSFNPVKNLQTIIGLNYIQTNTRTDNTVSNILSSNIYPYARLQDANGNPLSISTTLRDSFIQAAPSYGYQNWSYFPMKNLGQSDNTAKFSDIRISPSFKYTILKGLRVEGRYQFERYISNYRDFESQDTYYTRNLINQYALVNDAGNVTGYNIPIGGILGQSMSTVNAYNLRGQVYYSDKWDKSQLNVIAGFEQSQTKTDGNSSSTLYGYDDNNGTFKNVDYLTSFILNPQFAYTTIPNGAGITGLIDRVRSYYGNAGYTFNKKYTISASGRIDGSNYFGVKANLKTVPLWSVGGKWDIYREHFYRLEWLPVLQLRATYGYNGNLNRNITGITTFQYKATVSSYTGLTQAVVANIGNPELTWEKIGIANLGLDFGLKNEIITGTIEYYRKNGNDIIGNESVAPSTGLTVFKGNFSALTGNGLDIQINSKNINKEFSWNSTIFFSHATDKVTRYTAPITASALTTADGASGNIYPTIGKPVYGIWSYRWAGLDPNTGDPQGYKNGVVSKGYASLVNPATPDELVYSGSARPTFFGAVNNRFGYREFSLSVNISYKFGYYFRRSSLNYTNLFNNWLGGNKEYGSRWQKPGDESHTSVPSMIYPNNQSRDLFYQYSQATVDKGDHIRLQDISLSYDFNKRNFKRLPFNNFQLYLYANNISILWRANKLNLDPDFPTGYPTPFSLSFGIKANF